MKTLDFKAVAGPMAAAAHAVVTSVKGALARAPRRAVSREAAEELRRRAEINARGAAMRGELDALLFGARRGRWIPPRPDWIRRRG